LRAERQGLSKSRTNGFGRQPGVLNNATPAITVVGNFRPVLHLAKTCPAVAGLSDPRTPLWRDRLLLEKDKNAQRTKEIPNGQA